MTVLLSNVVQRWGAGADGSPKANRALFATFLTTAVQFQKQSVSDSAGGHVDSYVAIATVACNFARSMVRPREVEYAERVENVTYWDFSFVPGSIDANPTDRLHVGTRIFEVVGRGLGSSTVVLSIVTMEII